MFCRSPEEKKRECLIISLSPTGEIAKQNDFFVVDRMRMLLTLVSPVKEKTTTTTKNLGIVCKSGTCAEYHSSTIVSVSFESWVARRVLRSVGIITLASNP